MVRIVRLLFIQFVLALTTLAPLHAVDWILPTDLVLETSHCFGEDQDPDTSADFDAPLSSPCLCLSIDFAQLKNSNLIFTCARQITVVAQIRAPPSLTLS